MQTPEETPQHSGAESPAERTDTVQDPATMKVPSVRHRPADKPIPQKNKKILISLAVIGVLLIVALLLLNMIDFDALGETVLRHLGKEKGTPEIRFCEPDYDTDIFSYAPYLELDRTVEYVSGGVYWYFTSAEDVMGAGRPAKLLYAVYDALTHGDAETYNSFFIPEYFNNHTPFRFFTMQKLYNVHIEQLTVAEVEDDSPYHGCLLYSFQVEYCILENDGTYRSDIGSDTRLPRIVQLVECPDGELRIANILKINFQ